jgi:hypothetical protein
LHLFLQEKVRGVQRPDYTYCENAPDLELADKIEVAVLSPRMANRFAQKLCRSRTDAADAMALAE